MFSLRRRKTIGNVSYNPHNTSWAATMADAEDEDADAFQHGFTIDHDLFVAGKLLIREEAEKLNVKLNPVNCCPVTGSDLLEQQIGTNKSKISIQEAGPIKPPSITCACMCLRKAPLS